MQRHCDFCSKTLGLFSRQSEEALKDGLCLCKQCYESLWKEQPNPIIQAKKLAEVALKNRLKPEIKKIVVKRVKELASEERKKLDEISAFESKESTDITTSQQDESVNVPNTQVESEKEKDRASGDQILTEEEILYRVVSTSKSIFRTAKMLDFQGFSPFFYARLSLICRLNLQTGARR